MRGTALVSGVAGFLGSHLAERLLGEGYRVIGIDNFVTGRRENLRTLQRSPAFTLLRGDLARPLALPRANAIFHLACPASPPQYLRIPIATLEVNAFGTAQLLAHAKKCGARMLLTSTSEVYGDPEVHPQPETYWGHVNPNGIRSCYDEGKRFAEALAMAWHRERDVSVRIARIFNTYGPRMAPDDGRVVSNFLVAGWKGEPLRVQGTGKQTRSFCYVHDMVEGLVRLFHAEEVDGPVNLGNPDTELTILELANQVRKLTGERSEIVFDTRGEDDPERRRPDISKAKKLLGWSPATPFPKGLALTADYFRELVEARSA
jgi:nucleoside-diphosphate-sugar epimerase